ncbi:MAG: glycosyltransferase family 2 protein [Candidatus Omnitrophica bacterium]|nr:glycosyltransferase family 2 protein [Candidatus Omnitrophota bacterium]
MFQLSIVIPVYNEEENIRPLHDSITKVVKGAKLSYEIIFVDDGSTDRSREVIKSIISQDGNVHPIYFKKNCGKTSAFDAGFKDARGDIIITMDGDLQNDPSDIPKFMDKIEHYDVVCGWRHDRKDPWVKLISSKIANFVRNAALKDGIYDSVCSFKAYRRECLEGLKLFDGMHRFLPALFMMEGWEVTQIKINHHPRIYGKSKYGIKNRFFRGIVDLLIVLWMKKRTLNYREEVVR